jgi:hypothetical protein
MNTICQQPLQIKPRLKALAQASKRLTSSSQPTAFVDIKGKLCNKGSNRTLRKCTMKVSECFILHQYYCDKIMYEWMVSVTLRPHLKPRERTPGDPWTGGRVGARSSSNRRKLLSTCPGSNPGRLSHTTLPDLSQPPKILKNHLK